MLSGITVCCTMVLVGVSSPGSKGEVVETCSANNEKLKIPEHVIVPDVGNA